MNKEIRNIATYLTHHNIECYYVGGCVRDEIMGNTYSDIDICLVGGNTHTRMHSILEATVGTLIDSLTTVHGSFPIWIIQIGEEKFEFAMARKERKDGQSRTEFVCEVQDVSIEEDLYRRDFTMNAIAKNVLTGEYVNPYQGIEDIKDGIIRHVSLAFDEDVLRVYRAARFATKFGFTIHESTVRLCSLMREHSHEISLERVGMELQKVMLLNTPSIFFNTLLKFGWLDHAFIELQLLLGIPQNPEHHPEGDAYVHTMHCIDAAKDPFTRIVMLCHDLGKATTTALNKKGNWSAYGHDLAGVEPTNNMLKRIKYADHRTINQIKCLVKWHMIRAYLSKSTVRKCLRELMHYRLDYKQLVDVVQADLDGRPPKPHVDVDIMQDYAQELIDTDQMTQIVTGKLLISIGIEPGEHMGKCIDKALEWQDKGTLNKNNWLQMLKNVK